MNNIPTRRERRMALKYQGVLKAKRQMSFSQWLEFTRNSIKAGREIFEANRDAQEKRIAEQLEAKELKMIERWKELGHTDAEIEKLREAWATITIRDLETWHTDKKIARATFKEVTAALYERKNG